MKKLVACFIPFCFLSCENEIKKTELDFVTNVSSIDSVQISTEPKKQSKLLLKASCTEPFMYTEIFTDKAIFTFPEKDTLILVHDFDSLAFKKDFRLFTIQDTNNFTFLFINKPCTHPGSGENWSMKAKFEINKVVYQGCAKTL